MVKIVVTQDQAVDIALALEDARLMAKQLEQAMIRLNPNGTGVAHFRMQKEKLTKLLEVVRAAR